MKKIRILLFIFLALTCNKAFADNDDSKSKFDVRNSFERGLASHISDFASGKQSAAVAQNVRFNEEFPTVSKRDVLLSQGTPNSGKKVTSLHRYYKSDDTSHLLATSSTNLYLRDDDDNTFSILKSELSDGKRWQWVTYKDVAVGMNGTDAPIKYDGQVSFTANTDGNRTDGYGVAELGAPFADLETGTDLSASSWYQYMVAFYDDTNWYYSTARSNPIQTGSTVHNIELTGIPLGDDTITTRAIFRSSGQTSAANVEALADSSFSHCLTLSNNVSTSIVDNVADGSLGAGVSWATVTGSIDDSGGDVTPPNGKYCVIHDERLFISGNNTYKSDLYYSDQYNPDFFLADDFWQVRPDDGDEITFVKTFLGVLTIGKTNTIQKLYTNGADTAWSLSNPFSPVGSPAPYSVAVTPEGIFYLGRYGLYTFNGQGSQLISDIVTANLIDLDQSNIEEAAGAFWNHEYHLAYTSESSGATDNNRVLVLDTIRKAYAVDTLNINTMTVLESGNDFGSLYYGKITGETCSVGATETFLIKRYKSELDEGTYDDTRSFGTEIAPYIELAWDITGSQVNLTNGYSIGNDLTTSLIDRPDTNGYYRSPVFNVDANEIDKLFWNENLNSYGNIEAQIRVGSTEAATEAASWSALQTDPTGSSFSDITADDFLQIQFNLSTSDIVYTPKLFFDDSFVYKLVYSKEGEAAETSVSSIWESGWEELGSITGYRTNIKWIRVYYQGEEGTLSFNYKNLRGDEDTTFSIDLSVVPPSSTDTFDYFGVGDHKMVEYRPSPGTMGQFWKFTISDSGTSDWTVDRVEVLYWLEELEL